jgi:hypothetical protein
MLNGAPQWFKGAYEGDRQGPWRVWSVSDRGRCIEWRHTDGRTARTAIVPSHPDYPPDPTPAELKAEARAKLEAARRRNGY